MEQKKHERIFVESESPFNTSDLLEQVIKKHGLITVKAEKLLDARPSSLVIASRLSTGQAWGRFSMPVVNGILYVEGQMGQVEVQNFLNNSDQNYPPGKIQFFSFATLNAKIETLDENEVFLGNPLCALPAKVEELGCEVVIIHNFATASNHFLYDSEKDSIKAIQKLLAKNVSVIVYVENGTKGHTLLQSMADVVFELTRANNDHDAPINVACIKYPSFEIDKPEPFCLSLSKNNDKWSVTEVPDSDNTLDLIISLACLGKTQEEIGDFIGLQQYQVSRKLKKAGKMGLITRHGRTVRRVN